MEVRVILERMNMGHHDEAPVNQEETYACEYSSR